MMKLMTPYFTPHALRSHQACLSQELKHLPDKIGPAVFGGISSQLLLGKPVIL